MQVQPSTSAAERRYMLRTLFEQECDFVARSLRRMGVRPADVEDLTQEVFVAVHRQLDGFDPTRPARPWLFAFAFRVASNHRRLRRHRREVVSETVLATHDDTPERRTVEAERRAALHQALESLSLEQRAVVALCDLEGCSAPEAAESLQIPVNTVYSRLRTARARLREELRSERESVREETHG